MILLTCTQLFQCNCKQATELCQKKRNRPKMGAAFAHTANAKNRYLEPSVAPVFLQLWCQTDQQATSTVSNQRICHPLYHAQQNNFLKRNASLSSLFQVKSLHRVKKVDQSMIRHLLGPTLTTRFAKWWLSAVTPTDRLLFHEWPVPTVDQQALFSSVQQVRSKMVAPKRTRRAKEMLCS